MAITCCMLVGVLSGCANAVTQAALPTMQIKETVGKETQTAVAKRMDIKKMELYDAQIAPRTTELSFPTNGQFDRYEVELGSFVKQGDIIARTQEKQLKEDIKRLEESIEELSYNYNNNVKRYETRIRILKLELESITLDVGTKTNKKIDKDRQTLLLEHEKERYVLELNRQKKTLANLKSKIGANRIVAPHDGVVVYLAPLSEGNYVNDSTNYVAITDESVYTMVCKYMSALTVEKKLHVYGVKDNKEYDLTYVPMDNNVYSKLVSSGQPVYSSFIIDTPDDNMQYSDGARVVTLSEEANQVIAVPKLAIRSDTVGKYVYQKVDGKKVKTYIKVGITDGINIEITEGIKEGDVVYVEN